MTSTKGPANPGATSGAPHEIELKLELDGGHVDRLKTHRRLAGTRSRTNAQLSTYYDTPKEKLRRAGYTLRVRQAGDRFIQTLKGEDGSRSGMFRRGEWEQEIDGAEPDPHALSATPAGGLLDGKDTASLIPLFEAAVDRTAWALGSEASWIELVLDEGEIVADRKRAPILEVELELLDGEPRGLFALARELASSAPLRIGVLSKFERGLLLRDDDLDKPVKAFPITLHHGMTAGAAFEAIASACIRQFRLNEPLLVHRRDGGALHQARVALRRLRSAFSIFASITSDDERGDIKDGLRWISTALGEARDMDVFVTRRVEHGQAPDSIRSVALRERDEAFDRAIAALESVRFRMLMLDLVEWLALGPWHAPDHPAHAVRDEPIEQFARHMLDRFWRRVRKRGRHLAELEDEPRHQVRIMAKKLRYGSEFFASLYSGNKGTKDHKAFLGALQDLQTHLGELNDIVTAEELRTRFPQLADAIASPDREALLASAEAAHTRLADTGPFWR
jgi:triphosphatase